MSQGAKPPAWRPTLVFFFAQNAATLVCLGLFAIQFVWDQIDRHRHGPDVPPLPPIENYKATAENDAKLRQFVHDVLIFTLLHETLVTSSSSSTMCLSARKTPTKARRTVLPPP